MTEQPRSERKTQNRVIDLFTDNARPHRWDYRRFGDQDKFEKVQLFKQSMTLEIFTGRTRLV